MKNANFDFKGAANRVFLRSLLVAIPVASVVGLTALAYAAVQKFNAGDPLTATKMNANFDELQTRLAAVEAFQARATGNGTYSVGAVYCGATAATDGKLNGYSGAKGLCAPHCGNSPTAHMCTSEELVRTQQRGIAIPVASGWYSRGIYAVNGASPIRDCLGWANNTSGELGGVWEIAGGGPDGVAACSTAIPAFCCD